MANLILSYPKIKESDFNWIQSIRRVSDTKYFNVVKPHVTLVFGTNALTIDELEEHARETIGMISKFKFTLDSARVVEDDSKKFFHTFLIPSTGYDEINQLHDLLYTGKLASELRSDIPFIPHVDIGTSSNETEMIQLASGLNHKNVNIEGYIDELTFVQYDGGKVSDKSVLQLV